MKEIPEMISTKDLSYIEDMLNWNFIFSKKLYMYEDLVCDKEIKEFIKSINKMHTSHYEKLLNILK